MIGGRSGRSILHIGCGPDKLPGALGIDVNPQSKADVIHDLDAHPWPLEDSSFDYIHAENVLEHVKDFVGAMEEIHRVARPGATVLVRMPFMSSCNFPTDPTHRRAATSRTFEYFQPSKFLGNYGYSNARFELLEFHFLRVYPGRVGKLLRIVDQLLIPFLERHATTYEHFFAYLYPMHDIEFRLEVRKKTDS